MFELIGSAPVEFHREYAKRTSSIIKKKLGFFKSLRMRSAFKKHRKRFMFANYFEVKEKGMKNERILVNIISRAHQFAALVTLIGQEKALELSNEIADIANPKFFPVILPGADDFKETANVFESLKEWLTGYYKANKRQGIFEYEIKENTDKVFQINCLYCAFDKVNRIVEETGSTQTQCRADDAFFNYFQETLGLKYTRTGALADGDKCCQFRFELKE